jgi:hypothetical protein
VEIERRRYLELKAWLLELATHRSAEKLALAFYELPFEPYAPVRRQMLNLFRAVNRSRRRAGFKLVPVEVLPLRRRIICPFISSKSTGRKRLGISEHARSAVQPGSSESLGSSQSTPSSARQADSASDRRLGNADSAESSRSMIMPDVS